MDVAHLFMRLHVSSRRMRGCLPSSSSVETPKSGIAVMFFSLMMRYKCVSGVEYARVRPRTHAYETCLLVS